MLTPHSEHPRPQHPMRGCYSALRGLSLGVAGKVP